jgi:acyl-coenzyme A synthetase/AMP-(fatty) acid ligase
VARRRSASDPYKVPKAIIIVDELPKTSTGKIQKNLLRDGFAAYYAEH